MYFPDPPMSLHLQAMTPIAKNAELFTLGPLETGLDPVEALYSLRRVDAFGFVTLHVDYCGLAGGFVILVTAIGRI